MIVTERMLNASVQFCFPDNNSSCIKEIRASPDNMFWLSFLSCISVCTVFLNLLVIISISHFKQLHTPTNLLVLSLAFADLLVGLTVMPVKIMELIDNCWYFGKVGCSVFSMLNYLSLSASVCSMVFIAVDRYIAVTDPLLYSMKVTLCKMSLVIILGWSYCLLYNITILYFNDHLLQSQVFGRCYGECVLQVKFSWALVDLFLFFLTPCAAILLLYLAIFKIARRQAKAVRVLATVASQSHKKNSETKAAKTLGIVVFVYLSCWIPFYLTYLLVEGLKWLSVLLTMISWLMWINSSVNPLIYAIFYPWFRASAWYILSCKIFESSSSMFKLFPEHF